MIKDIQWPKKGDDPILIKSTDPKSPTWACLDFLTIFNPDDSLLALAFKESADKIINELSRGEDPQHPDMFFIPIAYLYRHSLELQMKQIIRLGLRLNLIEEDEDIFSALEKHGLYQLWNHVKKVIIKYWPDGPKEDINAAESIIQKIHNIDKSGQSLRYSEDKSGRKTLKQLPDSVDLIHFKNVLEAIFNFLDGCEAGLDDALQYMNEI